MFSHIFKYFKNMKEIEIIKHKQTPPVIHFVCQKHLHHWIILIYIILKRKRAIFYLNFNFLSRPRIFVLYIFFFCLVLSAKISFLPTFYWLGTILNSIILLLCLALLYNLFIVLFWVYVYNHCFYITSVYVESK